MRQKGNRAGRSRRLERKENRKCRALKALKRFEFFLEGNEKPFESFEQRNDIIYSYLKGSLSLLFFSGKPAPKLNLHNLKPKMLYSIVEFTKNSVGQC